jgi:putative MATE family efflux protein
VARLHGAGEEERAGRLAAQALWLSLGIGTALAILAAALAEPLVRAMGGEGEVVDHGVTYLRIVAIGLPMAMIALAGQGYLRGISDLRTPLVILIAANAANVVLEVLFVYGFGWGIAGSAWGTVIAQAGMGVAFALLLLRAPADDRRPRLDYMGPLLRVGGDIAVRTIALYASFTLATAVAGRIGTESLGAHMIAYQLFVFLALVLDAIAIAGQVIVGRTLGAGDADTAYEASWRMIGWSVVVGGVFGVLLLAGTDLIPQGFTSDAGVLERAEAFWWLFALIQPIGGAVFALDGILIGASDTRFLKWSMVFSSLVVFIPIALVALEADWGIVGVWAGLVALMVARLATTGARFLSRGWAVTGATARA